MQRKPPKKRALFITNGEEVPDEEFEPLFDYSRIQPLNFVCLDGLAVESLDESSEYCGNKREISQVEVKNTGSESSKKPKPKDATVIDCDGKEEDAEDWLPPPPKITSIYRKICEEDETLKALRLKKQELASFAQSAEDMLKAVEESVKNDLNNASRQSDVNAKKASSEPDPNERTKLVISFQDRDGTKQFRVFMDDRFERLFKMYADRIKTDVKNLVFVFDGDKISPSATPQSLGMEENDIVEVHVKASR